ncbi:MAG TPA: hypothetical protein VLA19_24355 [Herpetosiphonaceae bacterium]|nr:hypothetical protein [Herpetosiphonaceae bacterium]
MRQAPMIPLEAVIQVAGAAMFDRGQNLSVAGWIALRLVGCDPRGDDAGLGKSLFKKGLSRLGIAPRGEVGIDSLAVCWLHASSNSILLADEACSQHSWQVAEADDLSGYR